MECWKSGEEGQEGMIHSPAQPFTHPGFHPTLHPVIHSTSMLHVLTARPAPSEGNIPQVFECSVQCAFWGRGRPTC